MRTSPLILLSTVLLLAAPVANVGAVGIKSVPVLENRAWADEAADDPETIRITVASALIAAAGQRLEAGRDITLTFNQAEIVAASPRDRRVSGHGELTLEAGGDALPFRYRALYDSEAGSVVGVELAFGLSDEGGQLLAADTAGSRELRQRALQRIRDEFPNQKVELNFSELRQMPSEGRYQRYVGRATARFDGKYDSGVRVDGLYDTTAKHWLDVHYELGELDRWQVRPTPSAE